MGKIIGIDFGTSNICVAVVENGAPRVIPNVRGERTTPSVIGLTESGEYSIGQPAKNLSATNPDRVSSLMLRFLGKTYSECAAELALVPFKVLRQENNMLISIAGKAHSQSEIATIMLGEIKKNAEAYLGETVSEAVICVPVYFTYSQRKMIKDAAFLASIVVQRFVCSPTAAAVAFGFNKKQEEDRTIAIFDMGGESFNISLLEIGDDVFEVKGSIGDKSIGGNHFDRLIVQWLVKEFKQETGIDLSKDRLALSRVWEAAEKAKIELSAMHSAEINIPFIALNKDEPVHLQKNITRALFEGMIAHLMLRTRDCCLKILAAAEMNVTDIDEIVLHGGSTRIPAVQELVKYIFGKVGNKGINPDEAAAMGAAIKGGVLSGSVKDVLLLNATSHSIGISINGKMQTILRRFTTIGTRKSLTVTTDVDYQTVMTIQILEGEHEDASQNELLAQHQFTGISPAPRGVPQIEVTLNIDSNYVIRVEVKDLGTSNSQKWRI